MAEVTFVIKAMATLVSSLKKTSNSPSSSCKGKSQSAVVIAKNLVIENICTQEKLIN